MDYTRDQLRDILRKHELWLAGDHDGVRANLMDANLRVADLMDANLRVADLIDADLRGADLIGANLIDADLRGADLIGANLSGANLRGADLRGANLDYSCWPLWCGSLNAKGDNRLVRQLLYHTLRLARASDNLDPDLVHALANPKLVAQANQFHRANECGLIKEAHP